MKKLLFAAVVALFAACTTDTTKDLAIELPTELTVSFEDDTRVQLNNEQKTVWTAGDEVSVFYLSNANQKWQYQGKTGERTGVLRRTSAPEATQEMTSIVAVYPYNKDYYINPRTCNVKAFLPAEQNYLKDSYGLNGNIMVSQSEYNQLSLRNVCGWIKIQLTGNGQIIKKITLKGNNGEQVAGEIYIDTAKATATLASEMGSEANDAVGGALVFDDTILTEVSLVCPDGVTLGEEPTTFFIALPPQEFSKGVSVEVECKYSDTIKKSTNNSITITRNTIQPMDSADIDYGTTPTNQIRYTSTDGNIVTPYKTDVFGANIVSNTYEDGVGIITFDSKVTKIGSYAFDTCTSLTSITVPDGVTSIGDSAFRSCSSLTEFNGKFASTDKRCLIVEGILKSFAPAGLTEYTIPNSVTSIGDTAFYSCSSLTSVTIPDSVTSIGDSAFQSCSSLKNFTIPDGATSIGTQAFYNCSSLASVTIPNSITEIGERVFHSCKSLTEFNGKFASADKRCLIVDGVLNSFAPAGLTEYTIPNSVTSIGNNAFCYCKSLTNVTILDSVTSIGREAFYDCSSLKNVTIGNSVTSIGEYAFDGCSSLKSITIPDSVTTLGTNPFENCDKLAEFNGKFASADKCCLIVDGALNSFAPAGLTEYTIPNSVTSIGGSAFYSCSSLTSVTIPDSVTSIGNSAFNGCSSLKDIYCNAAYPPTLSSYVFRNTALENIYVYAESVDTYKAKWSNYAEKIVTNGKNNSDTTTFTYTTTDSNPIDVSNVELLVKSNTYTDGVGKLVVYGKSIPQKAFYECRTLQTLNIPEGVTSIGSYAFYSCSSLQSVNIPDSVTSLGREAFYGCSSLTTVTIPDSVTSIGSSAFSLCSSLTSVTIPDSVTSIGSFVFYDCSSLTTITIPDSVNSIGDRAFYACSSLTSIIIPDSVNSIGDYAFLYCSSLTSIIIPDSITSIGKAAFSGCKSLGEFNGKFASADKRCLIVDGVLNSFAPAGLTEYTIPYGVTSIGNYTFSGCSSLKSVTIPDSVNSIGSYVFQSCSSLSSVTIPDSVTSIGNYTFSGCSSLKSVTIPNSITSIGGYAFGNCTNLTSVYISDISVWCRIDFSNSHANPMYYGAKLYLNNTKVTTLTIPSNITEIKDETFTGCISLISVTIPNNIVYIGKDAFSYCKSLASITIPDSVALIGDYAFYKCSDLTSVYCKPITPPIGGYEMFDNNTSGRKIYVPRESESAYEAANYWSDYAADIEPYDFD